MLFYYIYVVDIYIIFRHSTFKDADNLKTKTNGLLEPL